MSAGNPAAKCQLQFGSMGVVNWLSAYATQFDGLRFQALQSYNDWSYDCNITSKRLRIPIQD